jgi:hypothetical protein
MNTILLQILKMKIFFLSIIIMVFSLSCKNENFKIIVNKNQVFSGEMYVARIYVSHNDSIAPQYFIIRNSDTIQFAPDPRDNYCGIYRATFHRIGDKEIIGFVKYLDTKRRWQIKNFKLKFNVRSNPDSLSSPVLKN